MPKPPGSGRKKGTRNKKTLLVSEILDDMGVDLIKDILEDLERMSPADRAHVRLQLLPYRYPKLSAVQIVEQPQSGSNDRPMKEVTNADLETILISAGDPGSEA